MPRSANDMIRHRAGSGLSAAVVPCAAIASTIGLIAPSIYRRDPAWLVPQTRGQDLVTIAAALALAFALRAARRGSVRAVLVWLGVLGYMAYTYVGATFAYAFNELFLIYVALFGLSVFALAVTLGSLDATRIAAHFSDRTPRRAVAVFFALLGLMLSALWLGQIVPFLVTGRLPDSLERSGGSLKFVFALDLGLIVPLAVLAAAWLWRQRPWGFVLAGLVLIKASTMGLALLAMTVFSVLDGQQVSAGTVVPWVLLAVGSLSMSTWFLSHCRTGNRRS